jgi:hypothetical protein
MVKEIVKIEKKEGLKHHQRSLQRLMQKSTLQTGRSKH